ncbi:MAG: hypothetical protein RIR76_3643 [Verrucomicrobiota bacterium]
MHSLPGFVLLSLLLVSTLSVRAQYPRISSEVKKQADEKLAAADRRSDEAWTRAWPEIERWAALGKPYLPGAAEPGDLPRARIPAFPGAQGGGMYSFGGRGGRVFSVTSLADRGPGTLREALESGGPRIVVFNVAGIIRLEERIRIRAPYVTLVGSSAPGDGVCIAGNTVEIETHDVIIRHLRFRRGATWVGDRNDSLGGNPVGNIIIDHVSASWGLDENMSMYRHMHRPPGGGAELKLPTVNITIQNSISSEGLNTFHHAFGSTLGGLNSTFHRNLWASNTGRNPSVGMIGDFTLVNNVLFNWVHRTVDGGDHRSLFNVINNYYKPGPATPRGAPISHRLLKPESERSKTVVDNFGRAHVSGNVVEGHDAVTRDNWNGGVQPDIKGGRREEILRAIRAERPFPHAPLEILDAREAYEHVLANAGATLPRRDAVDERVIAAVRRGVATAAVAPDTRASLGQAGYTDKTIDDLMRLIPLGIITHPSQVGGYPDYRGEPYLDTDRDGMPDAWEKAHGLNPRDPADAGAEANGDGYTNIEKFLHGLDPRAPRVDWNDPRNNIDRREKRLADRR